MMINSEHIGNYSYKCDLCARLHSATITLETDEFGMQSYQLLLPGTILPKQLPDPKFWVFLCQEHSE